MLPKHSKDILDVLGELAPCHPCHLGKAKRKSFSSSFDPAKSPGEVSHSDLAGKQPKSINGRSYLITFVDQYSRFCHVMGLRAKREAPEAFDLYKRDSVALNYFPYGFQRLHSDGGGEYDKVENVESSWTTPDSPNIYPLQLVSTVLYTSR